MVASAVLYHGFSVGCGNNLGCYLCPSVMCNVLSAAVCGGSSLVVEIILQLCICWFVSLLVLDLVLGIQIGACRSVACDGVLDVHVDDFFGLCIVLWNSRVHLMLLVYKEDLWGCQG